MKLLKIKWPEINRNRAVMTAITVFSLLCLTGIALASSGGEQAAKGWVATDTYKVMNFAVLAVALFFLVRKPAAQALDARIKGIKDQLNELEAKKKEAEKQLAAYNEKFAMLEQETEKLIADYVRQGNEAKARILAEAQTAAEKLEEQARRSIDHEFKQAKLKLQEEIFEKALAKAETLIKDRITAQDQEKLINEYIEKVVA